MSVNTTKSVLCHNPDEHNTRTLNMWKHQILLNSCNVDRPTQFLSRLLLKLETYKFYGNKPLSNHTTNNAALEQLTK